MTPVQKLAGLLVLILLLIAGAAGVAWQIQDWRMGNKLSERLSAQSAAHQSQLDTITNETWRQQKAEQEKRLATERQLATQDQRHTKELSDAQRNQARLRDQLATADVRLSVLIEDSASGCNVPAAPTPGSVVHAAPRARLDPAHAQRIIRITDDGDSALIALRACQAYVQAVAH